MQISSSDDAHVNLCLTPQGQLLALAESQASPLPPATAQRVHANFAKGTGAGLLQLGANEVGISLPPIWAWWRNLAARYVTALCATPEDTPSAQIRVTQPDSATVQSWLTNLPPMRGAEYLDAALVERLWRLLHEALQAALAAQSQPLQLWLHAQHPAWNQVGRVVFNLAENRKDDEFPFAFMATYTHRLSTAGRPQHLPLSRALQEYSGGKHQAQLLALLLPVQRAAAQVPWLASLVEQGDVYHPMRWSAAEAMALLRDAPLLAQAGVTLRAPGNWPAGRPARAKVSAKVGDAVPTLLGQAALLDFQLSVTLGDATLSEAEVRALLAGSDGLQLLRGQWVEVDQARLKRLLARFTAIEAAAADGIGFGEAMRLLAGATLANSEAGDAHDADWIGVSAGAWLGETLQQLRSPQGLAQVDPGPALKAQLRPYQEAGVRWLYLLHQLGLGACLADDMGLGKTIQVLALLLVLKERRVTTKRHVAARASLLVAPASLLANWAAEAARFAPDLRVVVAHPSIMGADGFKKLSAASLSDADLVITSYGSLLRAPALLETRWQVAVLDEAQAIKNPGAKQTRQTKKLLADTRIALTGTPVENRLSDLWSIFDFTHPGLLGSDQVFTAFTRRLTEQGQFAPLRQLVAPYILRRLKTDKTVIADLPDKTELDAWCHLSPAQAAQYQAAVDALAKTLQSADGMARKSAVLVALMRFKQICNHPSQWLGDNAWDPAASGKFARLRELAEVIAGKEEKLLVFTQFRETTEPLAAFLGSIFGRAGLVLHGGTPVAKRRALVSAFQEDPQIPFFVLSLKAGGAGLNLTAASHVIHFDRWWNPAVENQATDRAFRIGQKRNVLVHKFICRGTVEERINTLIAAKQELVNNVLEGGAELALTEMSDRELLDLVRLDISSAQDA